MASLHVSSEELCCPVCYDIFKSPVVLSCSHSVCKECLQQFWRTKETQECPVCRRRSSNDFSLPNMALNNLCESFPKETNESCSSGSEEICGLHSEKLKLFCLEDKQPVCVVCRDSEKHVNHTFRPISEVGPSYTVELKSSKGNFKHKENITGEFEKTDQLNKKNHHLIKKSILIGDGNPARYRLKTSSDNLTKSEPYRKKTFGEKDETKPHKTILMVGETGTGKTTLINTMINYMLGVQRKDKVWFEITDDQSDRTSAHSQTSSITVYGFYLQESPIHLTIIDTPGYGNTQSIEVDKEISQSFFSLIKSAEGVHEVDAVCLVINATQTRLSDRQIYIFDAVQSLFGRDVAENIVLLFTHSTGARPKNALTAVEEAKVKCAVNDEKKTVYFLFDNCQSEAADEDDDEDEMLKQSWDLSSRGITQLFKLLDTIRPKSLKMTRDVLQKREQLEANMSNLKAHVQLTELKQNELKQTQEALEKNKKYVEDSKNFEYEVEVVYKEKVDIDTSVASKATSCSVCKENCHYPGCWWVIDLSRCEVMRNNHCTVCTKKCHYSKHVKEAKIYVTKMKTEKRTNEKLKKEYDGKIRSGVSLVKNLEEELQALEKEKIKLVNEAFDCVETLEMIALNADSLLTLLHVDFLIEKMKEINEPEKAETLENIKKRAGEKRGALEFIRIHKHF